MNRSTLRRFARSAAVVTLMFALSTEPTWAWGRDGHRITALVAEAYLTPSTKAAIAALLKGQRISDIASWPDEIRSNRPETGPWHFVDIPRSADKFDRDRDCPLDPKNPKSPWRDCVTDRINFFEGQLGDDTLSADQRADALKFLVHFMGDIHQPMHAIGDDRGGNGIRVAFLGSNQCGNYKCNLHGVWDESILEHRGLSNEKYTSLLLKEIKENNWERMSGGEPTTWANVSHHYAALAYAPNGALLDSKYVAEETKVIDAELALGGLRLARVLNRILGNPAEQDPTRVTPAPADQRQVLPSSAPAADQPKQ
ncbi:S1/P1 nuclease [Granulicella cerasi]|uniref:S1/P1 nuclease n=1 Tax=Granulicella cerasi TaxID=741063 RepID=A0ABW1ZBH5_9BACT|nr:S1/P1 nuclease [Granulicella cerasi]